MCVQVFRVTDDRFGVYDIDERLGREVSRAFSLSSLEGAFGLVILAELCLDIVVDALYFLPISSAGVMASLVRATNLLQCGYEVCNGLVGPVFDLVPLEVAQVLINRLYIM
jgi:hypothetical protein